MNFINRWRYGFIRVPHHDSISLLFRIAICLLGIIGWMIVMVMTKGNLYSGLILMIIFLWMAQWAWNIYAFKKMLRKARQQRKILISRDSVIFGLLDPKYETIHDQLVENDDFQCVAIYNERRHRYLIQKLINRWMTDEKWHAQCGGFDFCKSYADRMKEIFHL